MPPSPTPREGFIAAIERRPPSGRVPHFELVFYLTMQAFGKVHPLHRDYSQWLQMEHTERQLHREDMAGLYIATAERFEHSAIFIHPNPNVEEESIRLIETIRQKSGDRYFLMQHGDVTWGIPAGEALVTFCHRLKYDKQGLKDEMEAAVDAQLKLAVREKQRGGLDGFALCSDYCFNTGPFLSPDQFAEFIAPYLSTLISGYRALGFYTIKHTDGNILPIIDQLIEAKPHALHSLDPQGGMDLAEIKKSCGDKLCLIGNVNCGLLASGSDEQVMESARYAGRWIHILILQLHSLRYASWQV